MSKEEVMKTVCQNADFKVVMIAYFFKALTVGVIIAVNIFIFINFSVATAEEDFELVNATFTNNSIIVDNKEFKTIDNMPVKLYYSSNHFKPANDYTDKVYYDGEILFTQNGLDDMLTDANVVGFMLKVIIMFMATLVMSIIANMLMTLKGLKLFKEQLYNYFKNKELKRYLIQL